MSKKIRITPKEEKALDQLRKAGYDFDKIEKLSETEYDIRLEGTHNDECGFTAWLPLSLIREFINWTSRRIANMSDYPEMAYSGDWSGIRDSSKEAIYDILHTKFK